jgi:hypothetical protein
MNVEVGLDVAQDRVVDSVRFGSSLDRSPGPSHVAGKSLGGFVIELEKILDVISEHENAASRETSIVIQPECRYA